MQPLKKVKLEVTTKLEFASNFLIAFSFVITTILLIYYNGLGKTINTYTTTSSVITGVFIILRMGIDEYYVLDTSRQALMLESKFFFSKSYTMFAHFKTIDAVVANGHFNSGGKNCPPHWLYRVEIVLRTGKVIPIDDWNKEYFDVSDMKAQKFAKLANVSLVQGRSGASAKPKKCGIQYTFEVIDRSTSVDALSKILCGIMLVLLPIIIIICIKIFGH